MKTQATVETSPSLALVKYWGKANGAPNLPASPSLAVGLHDLRTKTTVTLLDGEDVVVLDGKEQPVSPFAPLLDAFRKLSGYNGSFSVSSANSFPTAAGIASSSSGFAALAIALDALLETGLDRRQVSEMARVGSGSASRAVFGGFTTWEAGATAAAELLPKNHWPELRIIVAVISAQKKPLGSRAGMERSRETSPLYPVWLDQAPRLFQQACTAVRARSLDDLGPVMRESYLCMFSTMFTSRPPFIYWLPQSVELIHLLERMRAEGTPAWETMDAGPQVKIVTTNSHVESVCGRVAAAIPGVQLMVSEVGGAPVVRVQ